ncbi:MAG: hypothetical protein JST55_06940 [Bacteroidetes bacterium]|nr:hypothetical protein [Bacteroidota bacterium]
MKLQICIIETLFNTWGESLVHILGSIYYTYLIAAVFIALVFFVFKYAFKFHWTTVLIAVILCTLLSLFIVNSYKNGERMIELKAFGLRVVSCIENYKNEKNALPDSLSFLSSCLNSSDTELAKHIARYNIFKKPHFEDKYSLTLHEDFLGFYYLRYSEKEKKFIYTDE